MSSFYLSNPYQPPQAPKNLPINQPWALFGGISPDQFMKQYWHKKPLLVRGAIPAFSLAADKQEELSSPISAQTLFNLASDELVESRLVQANPWRFDAGPLKKKSLPSKRPYLSKTPALTAALH